MSRSGYSTGHFPMWRGIVASAIRGKRGQKFFRDLVAALDALPEKRLVADELETREGEVCALGAVGKHRGLPTGQMRSLEPEELGEKFDIAHQLAQEVMYENDEAWDALETPEHRWQRVRAWAVEQIKPDAPAQAATVSP